MTTRPTFAFTASLLLGSFAVLPALHAAPLEFDILRQQYEKMVSTPHEESMAALSTQYGAALEAAGKTAQQSGRLDDVLALAQEQKRLADKLPIPEEQEGVPEALVNLRGIYHGQRVRLLADHEAAKAKILPAYVEKLKELESELTKGGRIPDALAVKTYREGLATGAPAVPTTMPVAGSPAPAPAVASVPKVKGDDRKAAEWVLANWSRFKLVVGGETPVTKAAEIPTGRFEITSLSLDGRDYTGAQPVTGQTLLENLGGLKDLTDLELVGFSDLVDADLAFLGTFEKLVSLKLGKLPKTGSGSLLHLADARNLTKLEVDEINGIDNAAMDSLARLALKELKIRRCGLTDASLQGVEGFRALILLEISIESALTDHSLPMIRGLPSLKRFQLANTGITPDALGKVPMPWITMVAFGELGGLGMKEIVPLVAPAFPNVTAYSINRPATSPLDLATLTQFEKLEALEVWSEVRDEAWEGLVELDRLTRFRNARPAALSDAALGVLARCKKLKAIDLGSVPPSPAALAEFKSARPDVAIKN